MASYPNSQAPQIQMPMPMPVPAVEPSPMQSTVHTHVPAPASLPAMAPPQYPAALYVPSGPQSNTTPSAKYHPDYFELDLEAQHQLSYKEATQMRGGSDEKYEAGVGPGTGRGVVVKGDEGDSCMWKFCKCILCCWLFEALWHLFTGLLRCLFCCCIWESCGCCGSEKKQMRKEQNPSLPVIGAQGAMTTGM